MPDSTTKFILRDGVYASLAEASIVKKFQELYSMPSLGSAITNVLCKVVRVLEKDEKLDFVPNALLANRHGDSRRTWTTCGYTFLFNIVGVMFPSFNYISLYI